MGTDQPIEDKGNLRELAQENRHLKETVVSLREKLEEMAVAGAEAVSRASNQREKEMAELKATVLALREEMERQKASHEAVLQQTALANRDEIHQLQEMIQALRRELEKAAWK